MVSLNFSVGLKRPAGFVFSKSCPHFPCTCYLIHLHVFAYVRCPRWCIVHRFFVSKYVLGVLAPMLSLATFFVLLQELCGYLNEYRCMLLTWSTLGRILDSAADQLSAKKLDVTYTCTQSLYITCGARVVGSRHDKTMSSAHKQRHCSLAKSSTSNNINPPLCRWHSLQVFKAFVFL